MQGERGGEREVGEGGEERDGGRELGAEKWGEET